MASLAPSSRRLARAMVAQVPDGARRVVELGAGTGVFTRALLDRGIAARDLLVIELNPELHALLRRRFPDTRVVHGDACELVDICADADFAQPGEVDAVVSGLGFLAMPRAIQKTILEGVFSLLGPDRPLIQFTYGPANPLPRSLLAELDLRARRAGKAWFNVPPAFVYVYTRNRSQAVRAQRVDTAV